MSATAYRVVAGDCLATTALREGEILRHRSGLVLLRCPACKSIGMAVARITGTDDAPTLSCEVRCGCSNCAARYTIRAGVPQVEVTHGVRNSGAAAGAAATDQGPGVRRVL